MAKRSKSEQGHASLHQGNVGQHTFALWASQLGIVANPATTDLAGWDFVVDMPEAEGKHPRIACKVQVKTIGAGDRATRVKRSNCQIMATDAMPWVVVVFTLTPSGEPTAVHLLAITDGILQQLVRALADGRTDNEHKAKLRLKLADGRQVPGPPFGAHLFEEIVRVVGDPLVHVNRKQEQLLAAQQPRKGSTARLAMTFGSRSDAFRAWSEFAVGLRSELPVDGMTSADPLLSVAAKGKGRLTLTMPDLPSLGKSSVVISGPGGLRMSREFETYSSLEAFPFLPDEYALFRLTSPFVTLVIEPSTKSFRISLSPDGLKKPAEAGVIGKAAEFFLELAERDPTAQPTPEDRLDVKLPWTTGALSIGAVRPTGDGVANELKTVLKTCRSAWRVLRQLHLEGAEIRMSEIMQAASHVRLLEAALDRKPLRTEVSVEVPDKPGLLAEGGQTMVTFVAVVPTVERFVVAALGLSGKASDSGEANRVGVASELPEVLLVDTPARTGLALKLFSAAIQKRAGETLKNRHLAAIIDT